MDQKHIKKTIYIRPDTEQAIEELYRSDHCRTQSEFIEKCINYYTGYIRADRNMNFLSPTIMSSIRAASNCNTTRITRILFKLAVEMAISNNLIAATVEFDPEQYSVLKRECEREVRRLNGDFSMDDALRWQRKMPGSEESDE